jgi:hypothetical protein
LRDRVLSGWIPLINFPLSADVYLIDSQSLLFECDDKNIHSLPHVSEKGQAAKPIPRHGAERFL